MTHSFFTAYVSDSELKSVSGFCTSMKTFPIYMEVRAALEGVDGDTVRTAGKVMGLARSSFLCKQFVVSCWVLRVEERL